MHTFFLILALTAVSPATAWENNYVNAQQHALEQKKPLVVLFGSGANGWTALRGDSPQSEAARLISQHYVCVYVDTSNSVGKQLAQNFALSQGAGLVISDRNGSTQAFWHQGDMEQATLIPYLQKYADPLVVVNTTETVNTVRASYYPATSGYQAAPRAITSGNC
jgi:hypothetical protein